MTAPNDIANFFHDHPRGPITGWFSEAGLQRLHLPHTDHPQPKPRLLHSWVNDSRARALTTALERYFAGLQEDFAHITLDLSTGTEFQREVWEESRTVPWGETMSYGDLTKRIDRKMGAARAVGAALGANPIAILVPCHRFQAANGNLTGFAAGLPWKRDLRGIESGTPEELW